MIIIEKDILGNFSFNGYKIPLFISAENRLNELFLLATEDIVIVETEKPRQDCFMILDHSEHSTDDSVFYNFPNQTWAKLCRIIFQELFGIIIPKKLYISI